VARSITCIYPVIEIQTAAEKILIYSLRKRASYVTSINTYFCEERYAILHLTISKKLLLGYLFMALLTVLASANAVINLKNLNQMAYDITSRNFVLVNTTKSMMDALLTQESTEKKYFVFKDPSLEQIFWQRADEFKTGLEKMKQLDVGYFDDKLLNRLIFLHERYGILFSQEVTLLQEGRQQDALAVSDTSSREAIEEMALQLKDIQKRADKAINDKTNIIAHESAKAINMTVGLSLLSLILGIVLALLITGNISSPLKQLQKATSLIAEGQLDHQINIKRKDEIGALAESFSYMTQRLKILEEINLDTSPLTGLPGNAAIENRINDLLDRKTLFSLCQVDLDNFKPFADKYGYAWGSEVIKEVADILKSYLDDNSCEEIFIGHIGGDDFVIITSPAQAKDICQRLVADFEKRMIRFYDTQDAQSGYIMGKDRQGVLQKFPLITVTVAMVTDDGSRFKNPLDMAMTVAELKEYAKLLPGSNYVTEKDLDQHNLLHS
jgi:diguanylate cyclase (GGDEF)-like protein